MSVGQILFLLIRGIVDDRSELAAENLALRRPESRIASVVACRRTSATAIKATGIRPSRAPVVDHPLAVRSRSGSGQMENIG